MDLMISEDGQLQCGSQRRLHVGELAQLQIRSYHRDWHLATCLTENYFRNLRSMAFEMALMENILAAPRMFESPFALEQELPAIDVPSYIFHHPRPSTAHVAQYFDAKDPTRSFSLEQAELYVKQFAKGLKNLGLKPSDKVLIYSSNQLFFPVALWGVLAAQCVFTGASPGASSAS